MKNSTQFRGWIWPERSVAPAKFQIVALLLLGIVLLSSCSRPYATYQPSSGYASASSHRALAVVSSVTLPIDTMTTPAVTTVSEPVAEVVASTKTTLTDQRVQHRLTRLNQLLTATTTGKQVKATATQTFRWTERLMVKTVERRIARTMLAQAPNPPRSNAWTGLLVAFIGLIVILIGGVTNSGFLAILGLIGLVAGLLLLLIGLSTYS